MRSIILFIAIILPCLYGTATSFAQAAPPDARYTVADAGPYSHHWASSVDMNAQGHLTSQSSGNQASFFDGTLHLLGIPKGYTWSYGQGLNNSDQIAASVGNDHTGAVRAYAASYVAGVARWQLLPLAPGYPNSVANGITANARAITGAVCARAGKSSDGCSRTRAAVWIWSGTRYLAPRLLPLSAGRIGSTGEAIVKANGLTLIAGEERSATTCQACAVVWRLGGSILRLTGPRGYPSVKAAAIAHGARSTFYVGGQVWNSAYSTGEPALWTIQCGPAACRQVGSARILSNWGFVSGVNAQGWAVGYQRPNGDGAGDAMWWHDGTATTLDSLLGNSSDPTQPLGFGWGAVINDRGQIAAVGQTRQEKTHLYLLSP